MPRDWRLRIADILDSISLIDDYTTGMTFDAFADDRRTIDAVLHNLYVVGEAVIHLPDDVTSSRPEVPWAEVRGFRNFLAHGYFNIDVETIWKTVEDDIPPLRAALLAIQSMDREDP